MGSLVQKLYRTLQFGPNATRHQHPGGQIKLALTCSQRNVSPAHTCPIQRSILADSRLNKSTMSLPHPKQAKRTVHVARTASNSLKIRFNAVLPSSKDKNRAALARQWVTQPHQNGRSNVDVAAISAAGIWVVAVLATSSSAHLRGRLQRNPCTTHSSWMRMQTARTSGVAVGRRVIVFAAD